MNIFYSDQKIENVIINFTEGIFLAGPTPRDKNVQSWRPDAIKILEKYNYQGNVFIPERHDKMYKLDYIDQVEWERFGLAISSYILFWVPRQFPHMPAFTTNVEFGYYIAKNPNKVYYGRPDNSPKNKYLDWLYFAETGRKPYSTLTDIIDKIMLSVNEDAMLEPTFT